jgi:hypothetical protein
MVYYYYIILYSISYLQFCIMSMIGHYIITVLKVGFEAFFPYVVQAFVVIYVIL